MFVPVSASLYIMALFVEVAGMVLDEGSKRSTLVTTLAALGGFWVMFVTGAMIYAWYELGCIYNAEMGSMHERGMEAHKPNTRSRTLPYA